MAKGKPRRWETARGSAGTVFLGGSRAVKLHQLRQTALVHLGTEYAHRLAQVALEDLGIQVMPLRRLTHVEAEKPARSALRKALGKTGYTVGQFPPLTVSPRIHFDDLTLQAWQAYRKVTAGESMTPALVKQILPHRERLGAGFKEQISQRLWWAGLRTGSFLDKEKIPFDVGYNNLGVARNGKKWLLEVFHPISFPLFDKMDARQFTPDQVQRMKRIRQAYRKEKAKLMELELSRLRKELGLGRT